ncbi:MAG: hypothetical protein GF418_09555 [Chitinivibrionales bacterium]|nr:hypothetical protein [Chitinivibrionales bacterium]MBD3395855.1 hypothetical protein [Chitinivibrionales bacterium]
MPGRRRPHMLKPNTYPIIFGLGIERQGAQPAMTFRFTRTDRILWLVIAAFTALIYSTLSIVSALRKWLEETFGRECYNAVYWVFAAIGAVILVYLIRKLRGLRLLGSIAVIAIVAAVYWYYLSGMKYPAEKIHFLEYGLLGALLLAALRHHCAQWVSALSAVTIVYWIGLGDEAIQWMLPNRVGEIRDAVINLLSGALGVAALHFSVYMYHTSPAATRRQVKGLPILGAVTSVMTALFIMQVHGFGHVIETKEPGRIYSSFSSGELGRIHHMGFSSHREQKVYENEALRHLHQRAFYFTNNFKGADGSFYRMYDKAYFENEVLEAYYSRYLHDHADMFVGQLLADMDSEVAAKLMRQPLIWPDSLTSWTRQHTGNANRIYESRVKSTLVTTYAPGDLVFYVAVVLAGMAYAWWVASRRGTGTSPISRDRK